MRKLVTAIATAATLGLMAASAPAFADHDDNPYKGNNQYNQNQYDDQDAYQGQYQGQWNNRGRRNFDRRFNFDRHERGFDNWERGWGHDGGWGYDGYHQFRHHQPLSYWRLIRRIEAQGYFGVRGLRKSHWGWGYRAFAFTRYGQPVMLRVNPYSGRVIRVRHLYASY